MAVTRQENLYRIREGLDFPYPQKPNLHTVLRIELNNEQILCNQLNNTGKAWATATYNLSTSGDEDTYSLPFNGKPLFVVRESGDPNYPLISVPFDDVNELKYGTLGNAFSNLPFQTNPTIERMAFYRQGFLDATPKVKLVPTPNVDREYQITYLLGYLGTDDPLSVSLALPEHAAIVRYRSQMEIALGGFAQWFEDEDRNRRKADDLVKSYTYALSMLEPNFKEYISNLVHPKMVDILDWDSDF